MHFWDAFMLTKRYRYLLTDLLAIVGYPPTSLYAVTRMDSLVDDIIYFNCF